MKSMKNMIPKALALAALACLLGASAHAGVITVWTLPLPTSGYNVFPNPANAAFAYDLSNTPILGGDFTPDVTATANLFSVWVVDNSTTVPATGGNATFNWNDLSLYLGNGGQTADLVAGTTYVATRATYADGSNYESTSGVYEPLWEVTFAMPVTTFTSGQDYLFAVAAPSASGQPAFSLSTVNTCVTGTDPSSWDYSACNGSLDVLDATGPGEYTYNTSYYSYVDSNSMMQPIGEVNMELQSAPEPTTWLLLGAGIGVLGLVRRRRG